MANRELPMMPWFPGDFATATSAWTLLERALYRELLDAQWILGSLPTDPERLALIARCPFDEFQKAWTKTVHTKFVEIDGCFYNERLEEHREESMRRKEQKSSAGSAGGRASVQARRQRALSAASTAAQAEPVAKSNPPSPSPSTEERKTELTLVSQEGRKAEKPRGSRVPDPFPVTPGMRKWAEQNFPRLDIDRATQNFVDYWKGVSGKDGVKLDWEATWRNGMTSRADWRNMQRSAEHEQGNPNRGLL